MDRHRPPTYLLTLRPLPDASDPDGIRRVRSALKSLVRRFRIRCERIEETSENQPEPEDPDHDHA